MLWLSLSSSLSLPKYVKYMHSTTVAYGRHIALILRISRLGLPRNLYRGTAENQCNMAAIVVLCIYFTYLGKDNEEERDNHSIVSMNEYNS